MAPAARGPAHRGVRVPPPRVGLCQPRHPDVWQPSRETIALAGRTPPRTRAAGFNKNRARLPALSRGFSPVPCKTGLRLGVAKAQLGVTHCRNIPLAFSYATVWGGPALHFLRGAKKSANGEFDRARPSVLLARVQATVRVPLSVRLQGLAGSHGGVKVGARACDIEQGRVAQCSTIAHNASTHNLQ